MATHDLIAASKYDIFGLTEIDLGTKETAYILFIYKEYLDECRKVEQEAHGPHCPHAKQFQSVNPFAQNLDYVTTFIKRKKVNPF